MKSNVINRKSHQCIATAASCIPKSLQWHYLPEWRIKRINNIGKKFQKKIKLIAQHFILNSLTKKFCLLPLAKSLNYTIPLLLLLLFHQPGTRRKTLTYQSCPLG